MSGICPHCGTNLPRVVDAFCPECREALNEPPEIDYPPADLRETGAADKPPATVLTVPAGPRHTRLFVLAFYALAVVCGMRSVWFWLPSLLDLIVPVAYLVCLGAWAITDARQRRHPIPLLSRSWFFLLAWLLVPGYVVWSRGWRGAGWVALHAALGYGVVFAVTHVGRFILFGQERLRVFGL